jgi:hypothetical protein
MSAYDVIEIAKFPGDANFYASVGGKVRATGATAAAAILSYCSNQPRRKRIYAPSVMCGPMAVGDILANSSIDAAAFPAYNSAFQ